MNIGILVFFFIFYLIINKIIHFILRIFFLYAIKSLNLNINMLLERKSMIEIIHEKKMKEFEKIKKEIPKKIELLKKQ
jgi:hypothetical protein